MLTLYRRHLAMFGPREMLLSSQEPVVRQFLNARRQGPIGMAEEKDAAELAAEAEEGEEIPPLPPIPPQINPSSGEPRRNQRAAGQWLRENGVTPPPGSFTSEEGYGAPAVASAPAAPVESRGSRGRSSRSSAEDDGDGDRGGVRVLPNRPSRSADESPAKKTPARKTPAHKSTTKTTGKKPSA